MQQLLKRSINNRRSRAIARDYLLQKRDINFDAVKYRSKFRAITYQGKPDCFIFVPFGS
ncbi:MAG: hypothetical protein V7L25_33900 [Nostoc sp.]|uniref:hypothetical protein n=1 Tax=Nostoc sp. TaxID=1180 RepID=UPI002FEF80A5